MKVTRRRKIILAAALAGVAALFTGLRLSANRLIWSRIAASFHDRYGVDLEIDDLSLSLLSGRATARGLRITDAGTPVIEADTVETSVTIRDVIGGVYDFHRLTVTRPVVHVVVEPDGRTNLGRIHARRRQSAGPADFVFFREARIIAGRFLFDDARTDPARPAHLTFERIEGSLAQLQVSGKPRSTAIGDIRLDALLAQEGAPARITLIGWAPPLTGTPTIALHGAITGLDLAQIPQYVSGKTRFALGGDVMHLVGTMRTEDGVIADGAIAGEIAATGVTLPLRFGGTTSDVVFDKNSRLTAIFHLPFARLGHLGDVAMTSTWGVARGLGTGLYNAGGSLVSGAADTFGGMRRLDPLGALATAGGSMVGRARVIGEGMLGGVKHITGGGDSPADDAEEAVKQQVEFSSLHAKRRRAMLDAAFLSADTSSGERWERIKNELEAAPSSSVAAAEGGSRRESPHMNNHPVKPRGTPGEPS